MDKIAEFKIEGDIFEQIHSYDNQINSLDMRLIMKLNMNKN
jgi:hypothetical protein